MIETNKRPGYYLVIYGNLHFNFNTKVSYVHFFLDILAGPNYQTHIHWMLKTAGDFLT